MGKPNRLVIVESPAKARTIAKYLGEGFTVQASMGHLRDLPRKRFGVEIDDGFKPTYQIMPGSRSVVGKLRKGAEQAELVYLAPDPDREGEAIAWHLQEALGLPDEKVRRVTFHEITPRAVREAFERPGSINMNLVNSQQTRRILDRIVGYELSPLISRKIVRGLSAGRVQSVAVRLICEREREVQDFEAEEYWLITAVLMTEKGETFEALLKKLDGEETRIGSETEARGVVKGLESVDYCVAGVKEKTTSSKAPPPFITSTMQQAASSRLGFSASRTMRLAQQLYEGIDVGEGGVGLITYMRTDSPRASDQALHGCRAFIEKTFGKTYLPGRPNVFKRPRGAQAAHEAVRPTDLRRKPEELQRFLTGPQFKLYNLIWRRFVASQMKPARYRVTNVEISAGTGTFEAQGRQIVFDGYRRVWADKPEEDTLIPSVEEGQPLKLQELTPSQHFTQPPPRYTEASLIRELEKQGIGRPSTYAPIIATIQKRSYVRKEKRNFRPSDLGFAVTDKLVKHFPREMDISFTSKVEESLDEIEEGKQDWQEALRLFYEQFHRDLLKAQEEMSRVGEDGADREHKCKVCGKPMVVRFSRSGDKFLGCSGFPECKNTVDIGSSERGEIEESEHKCDKCGSPMQLKKGKRGRQYLACSAYPECQNIMGLDKDGNPVKLEPSIRVAWMCPRCGQKRLYIPQNGDAQYVTCGNCRKRLPLVTLQEALNRTENPADAPLAVCDQCGSPMQIRKGRKGIFLGCTRYPDCKGIQPMNAADLPGPEITYERCEKCGCPMALRWGKYGRFLACTGFPQCRNTWPLTASIVPCTEPECGGRLVKKSSADGEQYYGCTRFPECGHTQAAAKEEKKGK